MRRIELGDFSPDAPKGTYANNSPAVRLWPMQHPIVGEVEQDEYLAHKSRKLGHITIAEMRPRALFTVAWIEESTEAISSGVDDIDSPTRLRQLQTRLVDPSRSLFFVERDLVIDDTIALVEQDSLQGICVNLGTLGTRKRPSGTTALDYPGIVTEDGLVAVDPVGGDFKRESNIYTPVATYVEASIGIFPIFPISYLPD